MKRDSLSAYALKSGNVLLNNNIFKSRKVIFLILGLCCFFIFPCYAANTDAITNLTNTTYQQTSIIWTWTDPGSPDFDHVMVYLNGIFGTNVTGGTQSYTTSPLSPDSEYTIAIQTVDTDGLVNQTWVNSTASTAPVIPAAGTISVDSTPRGASIFLDGNFTGFITEYTLTGISAGQHTVVLKFPGYDDYNQTVTVYAGQTATINATLSGFSPAANFTANETFGVPPLTVQFSDLSTGTRPLAYQWDFGDGSPNDTGQDPVHTYTADGTYNVTLTVSNGAGTSTLEKQGYIFALEPVIVGGGTAYYLVHSNVDGADVYFNGDWFVGQIENGTLLVQTCPTCTPVFSFTVKECGYFPLTQNNTQYPGNNETVDLYANLTAPKEPLIADFLGNITTGPAPLDVGFTSHSIGIVETWNWSFGDGTYSEEAQPVHTYTGDGVYTVSLSETNSACQNSTMVKNDYISVNTPKPTFQADFTVSPVSGTAPLTVKCTDASIGKPTWYSYNFGDGISMSGPNPVHTYRFPGTYSITLTISKYDRASYTILSTSTRKDNVITVGRVPFVMPVAQFSASPTEGKVPLTVAFTDMSLGNPAFFNYNFGDGINMTGPNPVHTYHQPGVYTVTLTVLKNDAANGTIVGNSSVQTGLIAVTSQ